MMGVEPGSLVRDVNKSEAIEECDEGIHVNMEASNRQKSVFRQVELECTAS